MSSEFGTLLKISVFGQSHGRAIGVNIDGLPAGEPIDFAQLQAFLDRRRPGSTGLSTSRKEADVPVFLSGIVNGRTCGAPLCAIIENSDPHTSDYEALSDTPRPAHADYAAFVKWKGQADLRGGGHFSGRLTAPLCLAGGIAKQLLARRGIYVGAHLLCVGRQADVPFPLRPTAQLFSDLAAKELPVIDDGCGEKMKQVILAAKEALDSVGGIIECAAIGLPAGLGEPMFGGMENRLAYALFGIPALKGLSFGGGFAAAQAMGSEANDPLTLENGRIVSPSNHAGGILGGITNGMPLTLQAAFKPTPSIAGVQQTVRLSTMEPTELRIKGRHDPCVALRAVPVVEAVTAAVLLDILLEGNHGTF